MIRLHHRNRRPGGRGSRRPILLLACALTLCATPLPAGEVTMHSGFSITGRPLMVDGLSVAAVRMSKGNTNVKHVWMIDDGFRRYFVPRFQVDKEAVDRSSLIPYEDYPIRQRKTGRNIGPSVVGSFVEVTPFDKYGRRRVTLSGPGGKDINILQAITNLRPDYVTVESTSHLWEFGLSTSTIRAEVIDALLKQDVDPTNPEERLRIVRFYIDAGRFAEAQRELDQIRVEFPDIQDRVDQTQHDLAYYIALKALNEIRRRQAAGQHQLAYAVASGFPQEMVSADLRRDAQDLADEYRQQFQQIQNARSLLGLLEAELTEEQAAEVRPLRSVISDQLNVDTLGRLEPFLRSEHDQTLQADEKLALAYSGWLLGPSKADLALPAAIRLWQIRFHIRQYLRAENAAERRDVLRDLLDIDGATPETIAAMVPQLTPVLDDPPPPPGVPMSVELTDAASDTPPIRYSAVLPLEYSPHRQYPLIVALRSQGMTREQELLWWSGSAAQPGEAMKRGYIVISPEYSDAEAEKYDYSLYAHGAVVASLRDARKRFSVDSDRIFLAGHGMGGDAAFDIGMSQADLFAGVVPIAGVCDKYCRWTWDNTKLTGWYVVGGERDRNTLEVNARTLNQMMKRGYDLVYAEYMDRGYESYFEELPRIFDWMELHLREPDQPKFEVDIARPIDTEWYWLSASDFHPSALQPVAWEQGGHPPRQKIKGIITPGNTIIVGSGGKRTTIRLSPDLVDFGKRIEIKISGRSVHRDFVRPSVEALLEDLRIRGDRQRLYWAKLEF